MTRTLAALLACALAVSLAAQKPAAASEGQLADLAELLAPIRARHNVPALGAAVIVDGKLAALGVTGTRRIGRDGAVTVDDRWHIGSCTKAMTATLLGRYVEAGKLQWTTPLATALPDLAAKMDKAAAALTVELLLTHRAGLPGGPPPALWRELFHYEGTVEQARTEVAAALLGVAPEAPPGERFLYSNASFMIAGAIAERLGKASWETLLARDVFAPLGMTSAGFGSPGDESKTDAPCGHLPSPKGPQPSFGDNPPALGPAGTVHCSLRDWARFIALHLGVPGEDGKLLVSAATLAQLHDPRGHDYALGWGVVQRPWAPGPILSHSGSNTKWYCVAWLAPEVKFAVLVTCNQGEAAKACDDVAAACIQRFCKPRK